MYEVNLWTFELCTFKVRTVKAWMLHATVQSIDSQRSESQSMNSQHTDTQVRYFKVMAFWWWLLGRMFNLSFPACTFFSFFFFFEVEISSCTLNLFRPMWLSELR